MDGGTEGREWTEGRREGDGEREKGRKGNERGWAKELDRDS